MNIHIIGLIVTGFCAGIASGLFGIGGGVIIVPILVFFYDLKQSSASGTSLVALLLPVGLLGVWEYYNAGKIAGSEIRMGLLIGLGLFLGAYVGSKIAITIDEQTLKKGFALFLIFVAARLWFSTH